MSVKQLIFIMGYFMSPVSKNLTYTVKESVVKKFVKALQT